jgi:hypothetical protein
MQLVQILKTFQTADFSRYYATKDTGKFKATYLPWYSLCDILDEVTEGLWEWSLTASREGERTVIVGNLTIIDENGQRLSKSATGNENDCISSYGDPVSNAEAMAFRRACSKFGIGRELWKKEAPKQSSRPSNQVRPAPANTSQRSMTKEEWEAKFRK